MNNYPTNSPPQGDIKMQDIDDQKSQQGNVTPPSQVAEHTAGPSLGDNLDSSSTDNVSGGQDRSSSTPRGRGRRRGRGRGRGRGSGPNENASNSDSEDEFVPNGYRRKRSSGRDNWVRRTTRRIGDSSPVSYADAFTDPFADLSAATGAAPVTLPFRPAPSRPRGSLRSGPARGSFRSGPSRGSFGSGPSRGSSGAGPSRGLSGAGPSEESPGAGPSRGSFGGGPARGSSGVGPARGSFGRPSAILSGYTTFIPDPESTDQGHSSSNDSGPTEPTPRRLNLDTSEGFMPSAENNWKFKYDSPSGRTAAELDKLFELPARPKMFPQDVELLKGFGMNMSFRQLGRPPKKGLADQLVKAMEAENKRQMKEEEKNPTRKLPWERVEEENKRWADKVERRKNPNRKLP